MNKASGGTVRLGPGIYQGGAVINKAVRIVGDGPLGQVMIQSEGKEGLSVRSKGVFVQNVLFMSNGIGELPAVSVADGAELEMDTVKIASGSAVGVSVAGNSSFKALGCTFNATNGAGLRISQQAHASLTQCTFSDAKTGLAVSNAGVADLHACAFERLGDSDTSGAIITIAGDKTQVTGEDCHFNGNGGGVSASDNASIVLGKCTFKDNAKLSRGGPTGGVFVLRNGAHGELRDSSFTDGIPYAVNVMSAATLVMENTDVSGARTAAVAIGEQNGSPAKAQIKQSHFSRSAVGIGVFGGSSAEISDSECRENNEGMVVMDKGSRATLTKTSLTGNRDHGLYVYGEAEADAADSTIQGNARGAQSGAERKGAVPGGTVVLERCRVANNHVFGVGAAAKSQLILNSVTFEANGKTNVHRESGAVIQTDGAEGSASEAASSASPADDTAEHQSSGHRNKHPRRQQTNDDDARRIIRHFFPRP
ncbi:MAG: right-handed parallel beta-helix repeat-containing protein [Chthoniobacterales bacterium]